MKKYDYILLDWDGNLAKTLDVWLDACRAPLEKRGIHVTDEQIGASFGQFIPHMIEWGVTDPEVAMEEADQIAKKVLPEVDLYPDALFVLNELHEAGKQLALITTSPHENVEHLLEKHGIKELFDVVIAGDDVEHHKPHPEPLEAALNALGGTKELAVMIGDSDKDLGAAHNFDIDSILFYPDEHRKFYDLEKLLALKPTYVVDDFRNILDVI
ncbi:MAG: HAD-IA family hydrolase [Candidatus Saccharimonadales bacterium]